MNIQPPRSPISPSPPDIEIPLVKDRVHGYMGSGYFEQSGNIFYLDVGGSSSAPPPPPLDFYGVGASSSSAPFYPPHFGSSSFGIAGSSMMAPLHASQSKPSRASAAVLMAARMSNALFGPPPCMSSIAPSSSNPSLDIDSTSLKTTTLPENAYMV